MNENYEIIFNKDAVIIRTIDNIGYPIDIWRFDKNNLSKTESIFIQNMHSMAQTMISKKEKDERDTNNAD